MKPKNHTAVKHTKGALDAGMTMDTGHCLFAATNEMPRTKKPLA
jgi:hypothetical protein